MDVGRMDLDASGVVDAADVMLFLQEIDSVVGDANLDRTVDFADFLILSTSFGSTDATWSDGDFSCNGSVGFDDFLMLSANFR